MANEGIPFGSLEKTSGEQNVFRSIQALEEELKEETDSERREQLSEQIDGLRKLLVSKKTDEKQGVENRLLQCSQTDLVFRLYSLLLRKYSSLINDAERKTVGEIKALVNADDLSLQSVLEDFKPESYEFKIHYLDVAKKFFEFIVKEIDFVKSEVGVMFWLTPKEILSEKLGDDEDLAVFLCSGLLALGGENAEVVIAEMDDLNTHAFVITEFQGTFRILDPSQGHSFEEFAGKKEDVLRKYSFRKAHIKRFLYKFNHSNYEQFI
jgi:hypothetical protein